MEKAAMIDLVLTAHEQLFTAHNFDNLETLFAEDFIEHSPFVKGNLEGLKALVTECGPKLKYTNVRKFANDEYVVLHGGFEHLTEEPLVGFDIYRVKDGKIAEHWDNLVPKGEPNISGNTQLDGVIEVDSSQDGEKNAAIVVPFFEEVLMKQQYELIPEYTNGDDFQQHSPDIGNTADAMRDFLIQLKKDNSALVYHKIHRVIADGQFVLTHSEGEIAGERTAYCELWRVDENGKVAELWDAIAGVPEDKDAVHPYGIF